VGEQARIVKAILALWFNPRRRCVRSRQPDHGPGKKKAPVGGGRFL
jgi:hypothetical protein